MREPEVWTAQVNLLEERCATPSCGMILAMSERHVGAVVGDECRVMVWHWECAPVGLRAVVSAGVADA